MNGLLHTMTCLNFFSTFSKTTDENFCQCEEIVVQVIVAVMGNGDVWMREIVVDYGTVVLISAIITYVLCQQWSRLARYVYRLHLLGFETECADLALPFKKRLFGQLECFSLREENLKSDDSIRLVEIGVKTGKKLKKKSSNIKLVWILKK